METPVSQQAIDWREGRRLRAWERFQQGWKQAHIAAALGVTQGAVSQWISRAKKQGPETLKRRKARGATPRLSAQQKAQLPVLLTQGAQSFGFQGDVWTTERVAQVIKQEFDVSYHPDHVGRLLRACGWSQQKPVRRALQRDEAAIEHWKEERWPAIKKRPTTKATPSSS
jgi:transposase